jgi:signal transduction histidine kinase
LSVTRVGAAGAALQPAAALALLRIGQELVRNAMTHGAAQVLFVSLSQDSGAVSLTVRDDGGGLDIDRFDRATGGLRNAKRWAEEQGGTFERVEQDRGTHLRVSLPAAAP